MRQLVRIFVLVSSMSIISACDTDGRLYDASKGEFSIMNTLGAVGAAVLGVGAIACASDPYCTLPTLPNSGGTTSFTGGPYYDWDIFSNSQYRCRNISNGQFADSYLCSGMPVDDDRWPN